MIIDVTGIEITPGNGGRLCKGNGQSRDKNGNLIECCCDECDYMLYCIEPNNLDCRNCFDILCPYSVANIK